MNNINKIDTICYPYLYVLYVTTFLQINQRSIIKQTSDQKVFLPFFSQFNKCFLRSPLVGKVTSQKRHWAMGFSLFLLSPHTLRMCFFKCESRPNRLPHSSHLKGRRWSWRVLMCIVTVESWRKAMPHLQQHQKQFYFYSKLRLHVLNVEKYQKRELAAWNKPKG